MHGSIGVGRSCEPGDDGDGGVFGDLGQEPTGSAAEILRQVEGLEFVDFDDTDVVRHELVARIVRAYDRHERSPE